ncbi:hypothetical protein GCM10009809_33800 [Isoptericola hypogeus]|uniref:Sec-independent protein translocase protein TatA n=1 Tax=Isoptericola hypogeus TaxID=300179 RepID=A0ABN2JQT7_9MICO
MNILRHPAVIIVLILLVVLLFGSRRLPDLARSVGQSLKIFKKEVKELKDDPAEEGAPASDDDANPSPSTQTASTTTSSTGTHATTAASPQDGAAASQQVPGLSDPQQPRA